MTYDYTPSRELEAMVRRERIVRKTAMLAKGISNEIAEAFLSSQETYAKRIADELAEELFSKGTDDSPPGVGLRALLVANDDEPS